VTGTSEISQGQINAEIRKLKNQEMRVKEIAEILGHELGYSKKEIYLLALGRAVALRLEFVFL
jgi:hypothetical protein